MAGKPANVSRLAPLFSRFSRLWPDFGHVTHIRSERTRQDYAAIGLLVVLEDGHQRAADRDARAIQGVQRLGLARGGIAPARLQAARLVGLVVAAG
jgi:hypothetical protein